MATLTKKPGNPIWYAAFRVRRPDGTMRPLKKSTKRTQKGEALIEAARIEKAYTKASESTSDHQEACFAILTEGVEAAARRELSVARTRDLLLRLHKLVTGNDLAVHTVRTWVAQWRLDKERVTKAATKIVYKTHTDAFIAWLGDKADLRLEAITETELRAFRDAIQDGWTENRPTVERHQAGNPSNRLAKTTNNYGVTIASIFRSAVKRGFLLANPCDSIERLKETDSITREPFSPDEVSQLIETARKEEWMENFNSERSLLKAEYSHEWEGMILFGFYVAARLGDCANLRWSNIDMEKQTVKFTPAKTDSKKKVLTLPLHSRLIEYLQPMVAQADPFSPIFPTLKTNTQDGYSGLSVQFISIMNAGGIDRRELRAGQKGIRAQNARSFHSLRHTNVSVLLNLDVTKEIRMQISGHESEQSHLIYSHAETATLKRTMDRLPSV